MGDQPSGLPSTVIIYVQVKEKIHQRIRDNEESATMKFHLK